MMEKRQILRPCVVILCLLCVGLAGAGSALGETYFEFSDAPQVQTEEIISDPNQIYVSEFGDDLASGTESAPIQTILEALLRAARLETSETITIWLRGGTYYIDETIIINGNFGKPLVIRAYPGETPIVTGAKPIDNWHETAYMGKAIWTATLDTDAFRALYGDDGARPISRWPKEGTLSVSRPSVEAEDKFDNQTSFYVNPGDVPASLSGATVRLMHWWKDELSGVQHYDPLTGLLTLNRPTAMTIESGNRYWLENILSVSLAEGEWSFDSTTRTLYYMPREGESLENTRLYAGLTEQLFLISGVKNLTFDGISFARTGWSIPHQDASADFPQAAYDAGAAIFIFASQDVHFTSCMFEDMGAGCIHFGELVKNASVMNCTFREIGAQAVYVHGANVPYAERQTDSIVIHNNEIDGYGRNFLNAAAVLLIHARNIDVTHNEIHDGTYTAISAGWVWGDDFSATDSIRIRNNLIYYIGQGLLSDMGAIYMLGTQNESYITGNIIHDVTGAEYGGWGIYLDEGSSGMTVSNNLVYNCSAQGFHLHNGSGNTVINNIFAFNRGGQIGGSGKGSFTLQKNLIVGKPYFDRPDTIRITMENNTYCEESPFMDFQARNFNLVDDPTLLEKGFIPWVYNAGRAYGLPVF